MPTATDQVPTRFADPDRCPDCRHPLPTGPRTSCAACGLTLQGPAAAALYVTLQRADRLLAELRRTTAEPMPPAREWQPPYPAPAVRRQQTPPVAPTSTWTVPAVLLALGALCLLVGAVVFLAVTWTVLGVGGRTAVLIALTTLAAGATTLCARRGLRGAAEALAVVTGAFLALDVAGAFNAGWLGSPAPVTATLIGSLAVAAALALANAALGTTRTGRLVAPQVLAAIAVGTGALAAYVRFADHLTVTATVGVMALAAAALAAHRARQPVLAGGVVVVALLTWALLLLDGGANVVASDALGTTPLPWAAVAPLLAAAGLAAAVALAPLPVVVVRQVALVAACWVLGAALSFALIASATGLVVLLSVGAAACAVAAVASPRRAPALALGLAALGYAAVALLPALVTVAVLAADLASAVVEAREADAGLLATAERDAGGLELAAGWTIPVVAGALTLAVLSLRPRRRRAAWRPTAWSAALLTFPVLAVTVLCYLPSLLLAVVAAVAATGLHLVASLRGTTWWGGEIDRVAAVCWAAVAAGLATYHPATALAVTAAGAVIATIGTLRGSRSLPAAAPVLVAAAVAAWSWLVDWPVASAALAVIVAISLHAFVVGAVGVRRSRPDELPRLTLYVVALTTALLSALVGASTQESAADWLVAYLVLTGCAAGAVAILERSRQAAGVAAALQLGAVWLRLADADVETVEAYSLPLAGVLLAFGAWTLWRDPSVSSVRTLGPGLGAALVPPLLLVLDDPVSLRALLLAASCGLLLLVGALARLRAPLLAGAGVGAAVAVAELAPYHDAVPRWLLLSVAGLLLLVAGVRWEHLASLGRRGWGRLAELR